MYEQRDIVLIPFPYSDLTGAKQRPALIISNGNVNRTQDRICCLVTSKRPKKGVRLSKIKEGKLPFKSWVKPHRLFTIHRNIIKRRVCAVTVPHYKEILETIIENIT